MPVPEHDDEDILWGEFGQLASRIRSRLQDGGPPVDENQLFNFVCGDLSETESCATTELIRTWRSWHKEYWRMRASIDFADDDEPNHETASGNALTHQTEPVVISRDQKEASFLPDSEGADANTANDSVSKENPESEVAVINTLGSNQAVTSLDRTSDGIRRPGVHSAAQKQRWRQLGVATVVAAACCMIAFVTWRFSIPTRVSFAVAAMPFVAPNRGSDDPNSIREQDGIYQIRSTDCFIDVESEHSGFVTLVLDNDNAVAIYPKASEPAIVVQPGKSIKYGPLTTPETQTRVSVFVTDIDVTTTIREWANATRGLPESERRTLLESYLTEEGVLLSGRNQFIIVLEESEK